MSPSIVDRVCKNPERKYAGRPGWLMALVDEDRMKDYASSQSV
jgi:hypothetical protein